MTASVYITPAVLALAAAMAVPAQARITLDAAADHMSIGQSHYSGFSVGAGWRGLELGYRHAAGQGATADGASADLVWRWHNLFVTAGATAFSIDTPRTHGWEIAPRAGGGVQFGPVRATLRWEQFNHADGLSISIGLSVPVGAR